MPKYKILPGHSFRDSDDSVKSGGDDIELSEEFAAQHADKVELLVEEPDARPADQPE